MQHCQHLCRVGCEDIAAIPLKSCNQCSHFRGGYCYGFGTAKQVFSTAEAILCGTYTPLGQVKIGPLDSLAGQLVAYQIPAGIVTTLKLADLAVTVDKLAASSVINSKVAAGAGIVESKLNLDFSTSDLDADIQTRALLAVYLAHDHSLADPTQVDFNNLLNIDPVTLSNIINSGAINIKPSGDLDDYLECYTSENEVRLKRISGQYIFIESDDAAYVGIQLNDDDVNYCMMRYNKTAHQMEFYSPQKVIFHSASLIRFLSSNDPDNYIEFSTVANVPKMDAIGGNAIQLDGVDVSAEPARITAEIDSDITTHAGVASAHHTAYTDAMALAAVDEHLVLESGNATWINCPLEMWRETNAFEMNVYGAVTNLGATDGYVFYSVPLPTNRGGKKLYISGTRVSLVDADVDDFVTITLIRGFTDSSMVSLDTDTTPKNAIDLWEDVSMGALDCSGYHAIKISLNASVTTANQLEIQFVTVRYYYA